MGRLPYIMFALLLLLAAVNSVVAQAPEVIWAKRMGGSGGALAGGDRGSRIAADVAGNTYVTGQFVGIADFGAYTLTSTLLPPPASGYSLDIFVMKLNSAGVVQWAKRMGGVGDEFSWGIAVDIAGNTYVAGQFVGNATFGGFGLNARGVDVFVMKLDSAGVVQWAKRMGGERTDRALGIAVDSGGNTYVTGEFVYDLYGSHFGAYTLRSAGLSDIFVMKLDSAGVVQWAERMGGIGTEMQYGGIALDGGGNIYVTGEFGGSYASGVSATFGAYTLTSAGNQDIFVMKLDSAGTVQWAERMGGVGADLGEAVAVDPSGNTYVTGWFNAEASFGTYTLTPAMSVWPPDLSQDIFVMKLNSAGVVQWAERMGGESSDRGQSVAVDYSGNVHVTGYFGGRVDFGAYSLTSAGEDIFVMKLNSAGVVQWAERMGGESSDWGLGIALDGGGNIYMTGFFVWSATFGAYTLTAAGTLDIFVMKLWDCIPSPTGPETYGRLLFTGTCAMAASLLPGGPGDPHVYSSLAIPFSRFPGDRFYLSSTSNAFTPLIVDDAVAINGVGTTLGPYSLEIGVPPFKIGRPMDENLVPEPAYEVTSYLPEGQSTVLFELLDTQREIYGNTAVFLLKDCDIKTVTGTWPTYIDFLSHDDSTTGSPTQFDVVYGLLSGLRLTRDFSQASCLGVFTDTPAASTMADPPLGDGFYYLARGRSSCVAQGYGDSTLTPDPRDALEASSPCP